MRDSRLSFAMIVHQINVKLKLMQMTEEKVEKVKDKRRYDIYNWVQHRFSRVSIFSWNFDIVHVKVVNPLLMLKR